MTMLTSDGGGRWTLGVGLAAIGALAWGILVPVDLIWTAAVAAGVIGSATATAVLVRIRTLAEVKSR